MDLDQAMRTTFAARQYTGDPLPDALLYRILDAARFAPSGGNRQGTRVILIRDHHTRAEIARLAEPVMGTSRSLLPLPNTLACLRPRSRC